MRALDLDWRAFGLERIHSLSASMARWRASSSRLFLQHALLLLLQPGGIIALVGNAAAAIELEDPARHIVEEVAVMGHDQDRARDSLRRWPSAS